MKKNPSKQDVKNAIDKAFSPDLRIKVNTQGIVSGYMAVTNLGAQFILKNNLLEKFIDDISQGELCLEVIGFDGE